MNDPTDRNQSRPKGSRVTVAIAFAFGFGAAFGAALSQWITRILAR